MIAVEYMKGALLVALIALLTVHALPADETAGVTPKIDVPKANDGSLATTEVPIDDNNTTTSTTTTTTEATTTSSTTTPATTTPSANTTTTTPASTTSTTTPSSNTTTSTTTTTTPATPTPSPTPTPSTSTVAPSTTPAPAPTPVPHCNRFDPYSFVGGMILAYGSLAISLVLYKFYKTHTNGGGLNNPNNYRTL